MRGLLRKKKIPKETSNVAAKEDQVPGQAGSDLFEATSPSLEAANSQMMMRRGVDLEYFLDAATPSLSQAAFYFDIFSLKKSNVQIKAS